jgi:peptidoglycan/xylan/chitin deacetylase (PgdA/CDA1 family)
MRPLLKAALCAAYKYTGAARFQEALAQRTGRSCAVILLFHRVTDVVPEDGLTVSPARFRRICRMLRRTFRVVPLGEIFRLARSGLPLPPRIAAVTFDDCYYDNLPAARVLTEHGLPVTFFIPAAYVGTSHTFPWDRHLPAMPNLSWNDVNEMAALGCEIGSHTLTHPNLGIISFEEARREITESKKVIEDRLGRPVRWFAYPFGGQDNFRAELLPVVAEAGYEGCLSAYGGFVQRGMTGLMLPREPVPMPYFRSVVHLELHLRRALPRFRRRNC